MSDRGPPENVGFIIGDVSRMLRTVYDRRVEPLGLTRAQWRVLARISRNEGCTQTELAAELETTEDAVKTAAYRLRRQYGQALRTEIADTVTGRDEVDDEIRHLLGVLRA